MALRVILNNNALRPVDNVETDMSDVRFYIPSETNDFDYFVKLDNSIYPLARTSEPNVNYRVYSISNTLYGKDATELSLIGISKENTQDSFCTDKLVTNIKSQKLDNINSVYYSLRINTDFKDMYDQVIKIAKLNVEMFNDIKKMFNYIQERVGDVND